MAIESRLVTLKPRLEIKTVPSGSYLTGQSHNEQCLKNCNLYSKTLKTDIFTHGIKMLKYGTTNK